MHFERIRSYSEPLSRGLLTNVVWPWYHDIYCPWNLSCQSVGNMVIRCVTNQKQENNHGSLAYLICSESKRNHWIVTSIHIQLLLFSDMNCSRKISFVLIHLNCHRTSIILNSEVSVSSNIQLIYIPSCQPGLVKHQPSSWGILDKIWGVKRWRRAADKYLKFA